ncbi:MAG TPA: hypothetical protein VKX16_08050 [Chloroflexota bacterium]|nr:hypothetical protein [Chloroflexota bacterium]
MSALWLGLADTRLIRTLLGPMLLALGIVAATLLTDRGYASYLHSELAPAVVLTNGVSITLTTLVQDTPSDLRSASYVVQVPRGVSTGAIQYDGYGYLEHLRVVANMPASSYRVTVTVRTATDPHAVSADLTLRGARCSSGTPPPAGKTGFLLWVAFSCS